MRRRIRRWLYRALMALRPKPELEPTVKYLTERLNALASRDDSGLRAYMERVSELAEARQMAGSGPWGIGPRALEESDRIIRAAHESWDGRVQKLRETMALSAQGAFGDIELALQNVEWRREVQLTWLEFSRWGIQQIILITRLNYVKNPVIRRLIDVCAQYVFARGVEVSCTDPDANDVLKDFLKRNVRTLGQNALVNLERQKDYDGNIFFVLFADTLDTGEVDIRTIDATEINEIVSNPDDADTPWFYKRVWTAKSFNAAEGNVASETKTAWYPALNYDPDDKPPAIGGYEVRWAARILHRKTGGVAKWTFGCPRIYPALDWAKEARRYLEACASTSQSLAQIAMTLTTKGGQQALEGAKQQLQTTVGPSAAIWDTNPTAVGGSIFASGPGTKLEAFKQAGAGQDPERVRRFLLMCCMVKGVPETFLGDVSTGNLATATSLDRPTETGFVCAQEEWREDLVTIAQFVLETSLGAASGKLREAFERRQLDCGCVRIQEAARELRPSRRWAYAEAVGKKGPSETQIDIKCDFPAIREGDIPNLVKACVEAMTLDNKAGQIIGIDEKEGVRQLYRYLDIDNGDEMAERQYPEKGALKYDPNRLTAPLPPPIQKPKPAAGGLPQAAPNQVPDAADDASEDARLPKSVQEAVARVQRALNLYEASNADHTRG
jgi:hypothetical protein